ncbi:hypothetical protein C489_03711 [Natrinema versiforme JCM 10478]|uniref:Uncharacterized protein n=1 Tax=Natrinema versiforme JCM 10478 TaxID=1227496 RepID=L9YAV6_9EURY|nr:hypothetical protein C489_03711 [Natrinema versiforme JCM 10478]
MLAFILVFAIILSSVTLLSMTGFQAMQDYQEAEQLQNADRAMEALAVNFNDVIRYDGIEQRYGELALREGTVSTGDSGTTLNISIDGDRINETDPDLFADYGGDANATVNLGEFMYTSEGDRIAYEGGGLMRGHESESWSLVSKRPQLRCGDETAVISLVRVSADDRSIQSSEGLGFTMSVENRSSKVYNNTDKVNISVEESAYDDAWKSTLESGDWGESDTGVCAVGDGSGSGRVVVTLVEVDVEY